MPGRHHRYGHGPSGPPTPPCDREMKEPAGPKPRDRSLPAYAASIDCKDSRYSARRSAGSSIRTPRSSRTIGSKGRLCQVAQAITAPGDGRAVPQSAYPLPRRRLLMAACSHPPILPTLFHAFVLPLFLYWPHPLSSPPPSPSSLSLYLPNFLAPSLLVNPLLFASL